MPDFDVNAVFQAELDRAIADEVSHSGFQVADWFWSGRRSPEEDVAWWRENGPAMVEAFVQWYEHEVDAEVWVTPDGIPAIELPIEVMFGTIPVRMVLDLVLQIGTALVVVDLKTSARQPDSHRQLGIYACGLELKYGVRPRYGTFFMNRGVGKADAKQFFLRPIELNRPQYSIPYLAAEFEAFERGVKAQVFPAHPGEACSRCGVAYACCEVGGVKARELDPNWPGVRHA
jgi:putative RecB family exonuclease